MITELHTQTHLSKNTSEGAKEKLHMNTCMFCVCVHMFFFYVGRAEQVCSYVHKPADRQTNKYTNTL